MQVGIICNYINYILIINFNYTSEQNYYPEHIKNSNTKFSGGKNEPA